MRARGAAPEKKKACFFWTPMIDRSIHNASWAGDAADDADVELLTLKYRYIGSVLKFHWNFNKKSISACMITFMCDDYDAAYRYINETRIIEFAPNFHDIS